jgi:hypothetical protein
MKMKWAARIAGIVLSTLIVLSPLRLRSDDDGAFVIPAGTTLDVELTSTISTKSNQTGDLFTGKINEPIIYHGEEVVPESSTVEGHITFIEPAGRVKGKAEMRLVLDTIKIPSGQKYAIKASLKDANAQGVTIKDEGTVQGPGKSVKSAAKEAGIAAGGGAAVGAMVHGGEGAMYGAAAGLVAAAVHTLAKHHGAAVLPAGTDVTFLVPTEVTATKTNSEPGVLVVPGAH